MQIQYAEVFMSKTGWNLRYTSEPMKSEITGMFGTNELPLPYTREMPQSEVMAALRGTKQPLVPMCYVEACEVSR